VAYYISFCDNFSRVIPACIIDSRTTNPAIKNQIGTVIKAYIDNQLALVTDSVLVYRIETELGVLVGYFALEIIGTGTPDKIMQVLRPAFQQFDTQITVEISSFISNDINWRKDYLF
jgi:hypothetical protein